MSIKAIIWALQDAPVEDPTQALILCAMAETAHDDGTEARASQATYAKYARCSERTLRRHIKAMEESGVIIRGNQQLVAHLRPDRRPIVWNLAVWKVRTTAGQNDRPDMERPDISDRSFASRGVNYDTNGRTRVADKPKPEPSLKNEPSTLFPSPVAQAPQAAPSDETFPAFWAVWPRKVDRKDAERAYRAAVKDGASPDLILAAATEQAAAWVTEKRESRYIPHAATWLNKRRYLEPVERHVSQGHQTYRNPTDNSAYYESF